MESFTSGCASRRHSGLQSNADDIQGVRGEGTLVFWFRVFLVTVTRMEVLMCFRADILLDIPRVYIKVGSSEYAPSREGDGSRYWYGPRRVLHLGIL